MADRSNDRIVWIDCEMTGLDLQRDALVEIAVIVTEADLTEIDEGVSLVIRPQDMSLLESMVPVVQDMHTSSGLLEEIPHGIPLADAEQQVLAYITTHVPEARRAPLAGSSVYVDRAFLARDMPALDAHLHYRLIDSSTIKELSRRWYPRVYFASPEKHGNHRALGDIRESIAELRYYREAVFVPQPGPDTDSARTTAAQHVVDPSSS
ncbi:MAG: oligoribonuclease [Candidatus Nanopelagicales bacterium]|jgi:oligoribonuclease|nr:oligoribonuclease [Candidatus Nanopelagicales bacterium]